MTAALERALRAEWLAFAAWQGYGRCDGCGRVYDEQGRALYVARQARHRERECLVCYEARVEGWHS